MRKSGQLDERVVTGQNHPVNKVPAELLAVVAVDRSDRVVCQAPGCCHAIFRRIHIVGHDGTVGVYGSDCFERFFGMSATKSGTRYDSGEGRELTPDERQLLIENLARLLEQFETKKKLNGLRVRAPKRRDLGQSAGVHRLPLSSRPSKQRRSGSCGPGTMLTRSYRVGEGSSTAASLSCWGARLPRPGTSSRRQKIDALDFFPSC